MTEIELPTLVESYTNDIERSKRHISRCKSEIEQYNSLIKHYREQRNALWLEMIIQSIIKPFRGSREQ